MAHPEKVIDLTEDKLIRPVLPLRDVVVYPHMVIPLFVGRQKSIKALEAAMQAEKQLLLVAQRPWKKPVESATITRSSSKNSKLLWVNEKAYN